MRGAPVYITNNLEPFVLMAKARAWCSRDPSVPGIRASIELFD